MYLKTILKLMAKKYPNNNHLLCIYDDESGRIVDMSSDNVMKPLYDNSNLALSFSDIDELIAHLKGDSK